MLTFAKDFCSYIVARMPTSTRGITDSMISLHLGGIPLSWLQLSPIADAYLGHSPGSGEPGNQMIIK